MLVSITIACCLSGPPSGKIPVILTTDCGADVDDQWSLVHLARSPRVALKAVITTHAPSALPLPAEEFARNARELLSRALPGKAPDVVAGSSKPLVDRKTPQPGPGVERLLLESKGGSKKKRIVVLVIGAATDVASAILIDPSFADRVEVVAMAFDGWPKGEDPWNVKNDVSAWRVILDSDVPLVVGDGAVGKRDLLMSTKRASSLLEGAGPIGETLVGILKGWLKAHGDLVEKTTGNRDEWPIWDQITVAYLLGLSESEKLPRPTLRRSVLRPFPPPRDDHLDPLDQDRCALGRPRRMLAKD